MPSLELGCGPFSKSCDVGVDRLAGPAVDVVHDLQVFPWPLETSAYHRIVCLNVLEHLHDLVRTMEEIHRVAAAGAVVVIRVPTASSPDLFTDPTHVRGFGIRTFDVFVEGRPTRRFGYSSARFVVQKARFERAGARFLGLVDRFVCWGANRFPDYYESRFEWCYPMTALYFELVVDKGTTRI
jgi:SAM-dependent methyltransferase